MTFNHKVVSSNLTGPTNSKSRVKGKVGIMQDAVTAICKLGQGEACCAYLMFGAGGAECAKGTEIEPVIRRRLALGTMNAKGDNCDGSTLLLKL